MGIAVSRRLHSNFRDWLVRIPHFPLFKREVRLVR
jgi:hypothetical protein